MQYKFDMDWRKKALAGDAEAVSRFAETMLAPLYHFCLYRVGKDRHRTEEIVQETLVRALKQLDQYDPSRSADNIFPWLTGLARNEIARVLNHDRRSVSLDVLWQRMDREMLAVLERLETESLSPDVLVREETRELVNTAMSQLPPKYREALEAKYVNGASVRDMAGREGTSEKAVESLLTRAREAFRSTFTALCRALRTETP